MARLEAATNRRLQFGRGEDYRDRGKWVNGNYRLNF